MFAAKEYIDSHIDHEGTNSDYLRISKKYQNHFDEFILRDSQNSSISFLSGDAGSGKSLTLYHEYTAKLSSLKIKYFQFNFTPDKHVKNHYFLISILDQLALFLKEAKKFDLNKEKLFHLREKIANHAISPFSNQDFYKEFFFLLGELAQTQRIIMIFEDIHLAKQSFYDFIDQINQIEGSNFSIVCTTRSSSRDHAFASVNNHKWFYLEAFSKSTLKRYIPILKRRHGDLTVSNQNLLDLSGGNPFYINELYILNKQRLENRDNYSLRHQKFLLDKADGKLSIVNSRYSYLSDKQKQILSILGAIGFSAVLSEAHHLLNAFGVEDVQNELRALQECGFINVNENFFHFRHHLIYESIRASIEPETKKELNLKIFLFLRKTKNIGNFERLANHAYEASLYGYACYFSKRVADALYGESAYDLAYQYYNNYLQWLHCCSSKDKEMGRAINALSPLHSACLILGKDIEAENIAAYLENIAEEVTIDKKYKIYAALTTSHWTIGEISKARDFAKKNIEIALKTGVSANKVSAYARYGTLCMDGGDFYQGLEMHQSSLSYIPSYDRHNKFGMFVEAYPCSISIQAICNSELGDKEKTYLLTKKGYEHFSQTTDLFTKLFIAVHCGQALSTLGDFENALPYLEEGIKTREITKATLLIPAALSIAAQCHFYLGNNPAGNEYINEAQGLMLKSFQGSKKGVIDLAYIESLLINFDTEGFSQKFEDILEKTKEMQQFSYVGWLYFYNAIYHAFFKKSIQGFVGSFAKASAIAQNLEMNTLQENLHSLANLESTGILATDSTDVLALGFFDKAKFFYNLTHNVRPISFHIEKRTRS